MNREKIRNNGPIYVRINSRETKKPNMTNLAFCSICEKDDLCSSITNIYKYTMLGIETYIQGKYTNLILKIIRS